ncbi:MAG: hypothetical protein LUG62_10150 [Clostridiales bacterium]|nr:hypothetical protein [Clostridiales bacterium]
MVSRYGMADELGMVAMERVENPYLGGDAALHCSDAMAEEIDRRVIAIVKEQQKVAEDILRANMEKLNRLAEYLFREEVISGDTFMEMLG